MKIVYCSLDSANNYAMPWSNIWNDNLYKSLIKLCNVVLPTFSVSQQYAECFARIKSAMTPEKARKYYSYKLLEDVKKEEKKSHIDLFFSYYYSKCILPDVIDEMKNLGIITVNFYCNNIHQFDLVSEIAPHYDYCMVPEQEALQKYVDIGANPIHIQMAANPEIYGPYPLKRKYDVTFVGQNYLNRQDYVEFLYKNGIDVHVWGPGWKSALSSNAKGILNKLKSKVGLSKATLPKTNVGELLSDEELIKMYSRSKISLNFSEVVASGRNYNPGPIKRYIRLRDFEAPMSGAFYITGYQDELKEYYEIGKEIVCYDTKRELLKKIRYYLKHQDEAEAIRIAGHKRALKDHIWENRFKELFNKIGLKYD